MTTALLRQYRSICREIEEKEDELSGYIAFDTVAGSGNEFPFTKHAVKVGGVVPGKENAERLRDIAELKRTRYAVERFVAGIPDSMTRRVFEWRYIRGGRAPSWRAIAVRIGGTSEDAVKKTVYRYLKNYSKK